MDLATFRKQRGLTQDQLASELGFASKTYISQLETGAVPTPLRLALQIEVWSEGGLCALSLLTPEDAELLRAAIVRAGGQVPAEALPA